MPSYLQSGVKPKKIIQGGQVVKKIVQGIGGSAVTLWQNTIPRQGLIKSGNQSLSNNVWEKLTGFILDPAYPETQAQALTSDGLMVTGRASFYVYGSAKTTSTSSYTRGVRVTANGAVAAEISTSNAQGSVAGQRECSAVVYDSTDTFLELYALTGSSLSSNRTIEGGDYTKFYYLVGDYYDFPAAVAYGTAASAELPMVATATASIPYVTGSGIMLDPGTYQVFWRTQLPGTIWSIGMRTSTGDTVMNVAASSSFTVQAPQTFTVATRGYALPIARPSNAGTIGAGGINMFIVKVS
ncbi:hypothetical protein SEA_REYNAULD_40 [Rhodococcus phage Reynauld]|uniref:Uncharacterized protein n=1 Tax=Rhodococcus phage Reynauld TaxID=3062845 RepID=A0ACD4UH79_9CAUD|nr:hypothetical protein SEA_REYNAULD_40 [Rhodococcus phage Reynauld]